MKVNYLRNLLDIGFTNVWTTNFDNAIELNYQKRDILTNNGVYEFGFQILILINESIYLKDGDVTT